MNFVAIYRDEHLPTFGARLQRLINGQVHIVSPKCGFFFFLYSLFTFKVKRVVFISLDNYWERLIFNLSNTYPIDKIYIQHGHLQLNRIQIGNKYTVAKIFMLLIYSGFVFFGKTVRKIKNLHGYNFDKAIFFNEDYQKVIYKSRCITSTKTLFGVPCKSKKNGQTNKKYLFLHENFLSAGIVDFPVQKEVLILKNLSKEFKESGLMLDIKLHPMDATRSLYRDFQNDQLKESAEEILFNYEGVIGLSSSALLSAQASGLKVFAFNYYEDNNNENTYEWDKINRSVEELINSIGKCETSKTTPKYRKLKPLENKSLKKFINN